MDFKIIKFVEDLELVDTQKASIVKTLYELLYKYNVLLGNGKWRRHIKLVSLNDITDKYCMYYIKQIISIEEKV